MKSATSKQSQFSDALESLSREVAWLSERLTALEKLAPAKATEPAARRAEDSQADGLSPELVTVISAAVAAYLGVKPYIRQIRLLNKNPWGLQGRVTIQASHTLGTHYG
jgi:hypothetical protein